MEQITVFTATFNRAHLLPRLYESLKRQTVKNFVWLVIDDGSSDGTTELIDTWCHNADNGFRIEYRYKQNGGLHTAFNLACKNLQTELCVTVDSDDFLADTAIEEILGIWNSKATPEIAGIIGLDEDSTNHQMMGDAFPDIDAINMIDLFLGKYKIVNADRTIVMRSDLYKEYGPIEEFDGEKFATPHCIELNINKKYDMLPLNKVLKIVEYQNGGLSNSMLRLYKNNPNGFALTRLNYLSLPNTSYKFRVKQCVHLVSSCVLTGHLFSALKKYRYGGLEFIIGFFPGLALATYISIAGKRLQK